MRAVSAFFVGAVFLMIALPVVASRKLSITGDKSSVHGDEEMTITASASGFTPGESIFIKGAFSKEGSTNYFGLTKAGDSWIKNSTKTKDQRAVVIGAWDGSLVVKSDYDDSGFSGNGNYLLKVGFYTLGKDGDPASVDWSDNSLEVTLEQPPPTLTPIPTSKPTATPKPAATAKATEKPTATKTPTATSQPFAVSVPTAFADPEGDILPEAASTDEAELESETTILGVTEDHLPDLEHSVSDSTVSATNTHKPLSVLPFIYTALASGVLSIISLGYILFRQRTADCRHQMI